MQNVRRLTAGVLDEQWKMFFSSARSEDEPFHRNEIEDKACNSADSHCQFRSCKKGGGVQDKHSIESIRDDCTNNVCTQIMNELGEKIWPCMRTKSVSAVDQPSDHNGAGKRESLCSKCMYPMPSQ